MGSSSGSARRTPVYILTALLWLATSAIGLSAIYYLHAASILIYDALGGNEYRVGVLIGQVTVLVGALLWIASVIVSGEFHLKHAGERKSWVIIAWMLGIELTIVILGVIATRAI